MPSILSLVNLNTLNQITTNKGTNVTNETCSYSTRSNLSILPTGEIIYFVASVVVLHNLEEQSQRHYLGHTEEIKCMAVHPNMMIAATGKPGEGETVTRDITWEQT